MPGFLLDTNHLSAALNPGSPVHRRLRQARSLGQKCGVCVPVLCELEVAIEQSARREQNHQALTLLLAYLRIWPMEANLAPTYAALFLDLRRRGRALSQIDIMLAALASETLLTTDRDFEALPAVRTENWTV